MRVILGSTLAVMLVATVGFTAGGKGQKIDAKKLVGKWQSKVVHKDFKASFEFTKDGNVAFLMAFNGVEWKVDGMYSVNDNKINMTKIKRTGPHDETTDTKSITIVKLTDTELVIANDNIKPVAFLRAKDK